jgi:hypothetical protein
MSAKARGKRRRAGVRPFKRATRTSTQPRTQNRGVPAILTPAWGRLHAREPVLSKKALAYARKIVKDRKLAIQFLKKAGFIERPGRLARPYR